MTVRAYGCRTPRLELADGRGPVQPASGRAAPRAADAAPQAGRRAMLAATALVTLAGATAGCTAAGTSAATPPAATGAATGGTGNGGNQAAVPQCPAVGLIIRSGAAQAAAGHSYLTVIFTNSSATPCVLQGYPGAELTTADGGTLDAQRTSGGPAPTRVTLTPGQSASALIGWEHFPQNGSATVSPADCPGYGATTLLVTAPDQTAPTRLTPPDTTSPVCWGFDVSPVVPGSTGRSPASS